MFCGVLTRVFVEHPEKTEVFQVFHAVFMLVPTLLASIVAGLRHDDTIRARGVPVKTATTIERQAAKKEAEKTNG